MFLIKFHHVPIFWDSYDTEQNYISDTMIQYWVIILFVQQICMILL